MILDGRTACPTESAQCSCGSSAVWRPTRTARTTHTRLRSFASFTPRSRRRAASSAAPRGGTGRPGRSETCPSSCLPGRTRVLVETSIAALAGPRKKKQSFVRTRHESPFGCASIYNTNVKKVYFFFVFFYCYQTLLPNTRFPPKRSATLKVAGTWESGAKYDRNFGPRNAQFLLDLSILGEPIGIRGDRLLL